MLKGKKIAVGVCGGIAAYKVVDVVSRLKKLGAEIRVIMTKSAQEFVTPLTFMTISQNLVTTDMFKEPTTYDVEHIETAKWADAFLIAPATANIIGKVASGIADDMLSTTIMATKAPVVFAASMNDQMYENKIVQDNIKKLKDYGYLFIEPDEGFLACNTVGKGRLKEPAEIVEYMVDLLSYQKDLEGINVLVTAGPTIEPIDPVRYITNHSSGKMGYEIARAAKKRGAKVTLVSGQTSLTKITGIDTVYVKTAQDMYNAVMENYKTSDIIVKSAAVADFTPENVSVNKIKKENDELVIKLKKTKDILSELGKLKGEKQVLVGFAMETENLVENAKAKLYGKNLDMIVANNLNDEGAGFRVDTNKVVILTKDEELDLPLMEKERLAHIILDNAKKILNSKKG